MKKFMGLTVAEAQKALEKAFDKVAYKEEKVEYTDGTYDIETGFYVLDDHSDTGYYIYVEDGLTDDWASMWPWEMDF